MEPEDGWSWKTFLQPLNFEFFAEDDDDDGNDKDEYRGNDDDDDVRQSLVGRVSANLTEQHDETSRRKEVALNKARGDLEELLVEVDFKELERRWKLYEKALRMKSDRESTGSTWKVAMLERYIQRQDIEFVQLESQFDLTDEALQKICERVDLAMKAASGKNGNVENLARLHLLSRSTESDSRMILDAILQPLCVYKGLTVRPEQTIKSVKLPNNRYDYILYYQNQPIGVVEAKRQGYLKDQSVAQLIAQLLLLSSGKPNFFYFGILSDGYQYVFAGLSKRKVVFFQTDDMILEVTTANSEGDVKSIVRKISWLIQQALQSREEPRPLPRLLSSTGSTGLWSTPLQQQQPTLFPGPLVTPWRWPPFASFQGPVFGPFPHQISSPSSQPPSFVHCPSFPQHTMQYSSHPHWHG